MRHSDLKEFINTGHYTEVKNKFSLKNEEPSRSLHGTLETHGSPLHVLRNPCWRAQL